MYRDNVEGEDSSKANYRIQIALGPFREYSPFDFGKWVHLVQVHTVRSSCGTLIHSPLHFDQPGLSSREKHDRLMTILEGWGLMY